jgi:hypothetical protein
MGNSTIAISYLDAPRLLRALSAGIGHLFQRREYLNRSNVFPVPDGDTGTNMAFTFKAILEGHGRVHSCHVTEAGPALGVHLGPGGLVVAFLPQADAFLDDAQFKTGRTGLI